MTKYDFDQVPDRRASDSIKWHAYEADVLPLWVADMDFISPEPVLRALQERVEHGIFGYPDEIAHTSQPGGPPDLRQVIVEHLAQLYRWQIQLDDVILLPGVVTGFNLACHALASPQEAALVQTPVYPPILHAAENTGILGQEMELTRGPDGSYSVDEALFAASFSPQTRLFLLCNPHNPVGKVFTPTELERMAEICLQKGVTIVSDEIHCDLVFPGHPHTPIASLAPEIAQNTITLLAPSKTYNIAGLQCSLAIIQNTELRRRFQQAKKGLVPWVNLMGVTAARAAYLEGQEWLEQVLVYLAANRDYLAHAVSQELPGIQMSPVQGTYLAWLDCRQAGDLGNPYKFFLEKGRLAFNDGDTFGQGGQGFLRLNFGCPRATLVEAVERMKKALQGAKF
ncbi:MAG: PatB family C-S lyase [Anaerolineales bacterium]|nr:PatB family C-S lyase [Anaerolineales bacterium]